MKKFGTTFLMVYSILMLLGCEKKSDYIIEYSTTGCFGDCPVLDIKFIDNKLYYNFIKHNNKKGVFNSNVSKEQKQVINSLISTLLNEDIKKEYLGDVVDVPATYFKLRLEDDREIKTNYDDYIAPKSLDSLYSYLLSISKDNLTPFEGRAIDFSTRKEIGTEVFIPPPPPPKRED